MLLRVGIDKGTDGALAPLFSDGSFVCIPPSEWDSTTREQRTYLTTIGWNGCPLATYLPKRVGTRVLHDDPEFVMCTYGDASAKRRYILRLQKGDLLVFYEGLQPFHTQRYAPALYLIGYFTIQHIIDFNELSLSEIEECRKRYPHNAHMKQSVPTTDLVIVVGDPARSTMLDKAVRISEARPMKSGRMGQAVSTEVEQALGIHGFIERSIPPRFVQGDRYLADLLKMLGVPVVSHTS
jgi:hypothetical protein